MGGPASGGATILARSLLKGMLMTQIKIGATATLGVIVLTAVGVIAAGAGDRNDPEPGKEPEALPRGLASGRGRSLQILRGLGVLPLSGTRRHDADRGQDDHRQGGGRTDLDLGHEHPLQQDPGQDCRASGGRAAHRRGDRRPDQGRRDGPRGRRRGTSPRGEEGHGPRGPDIAAGQAVPEPLSGPPEPGPELRHRPPELPGRLLVGQPFQVAEDDRQAQPLGQAIDLLVQDR